MVDDSTAAQALRKRIYASLTGIATVAILLGYAEETSPGSAAASLAVTMGGLWAASIVADLVAHPAAHEEAPGRSHWHRIAIVAGQALDITIVPVAAIALADTGIWTVRTGLVIAEVALVVALVAAALRAVQRLTIGLGRRAVIVAVELGLAALVISINLLAQDRDRPASRAGGNSGRPGEVTRIEVTCAARPAVSWR